MKAVLLLIAASLSLNAVSAALAQTPPPPPPPPPISTPNGGLFDNNRLTTEAFDRELSNQRFKNAAFQGARAKDIERANRIASLIDNGQCDAAHQLALAEGDRRMAGRTIRICRERAKKR